MQMTDYQLGATILTALRVAGYNGHVDLTEFMAIERVLDPTEKWLSDISPTDQVPKELALQILEWAALSSEYESYKQDNLVIAVVNRYQDSLCKIEKAFQDELKSILGHHPTSNEISDFVDQQTSRVAAKKLRDEKMRPLHLEMLAQRVKADIARREALESPYERQMREWHKTDEYKEWKKKSEFENKRLADDMGAFHAWMIRNDPNRRGER